MELFKHQERFLERNPNKCLLCWDTGSGKTFTSLLWAKSRGAAHDTLVICPKALKENWQRAAGTIFPFSSSRVNLVTKEEFRRDWESYPDGVKRIIVDEAHYFAGMKSAMSKSLRKFIRKHGVVEILLLTATPYMSTPWNIYVLAGHLGYMWSYPKFKDKFFEERYLTSKVPGRGQMRRTVPVIKRGIEGDIASLVARIGDVVRLDECADIPEQLFVPPEFFDLTPEQVRAKKDVLEFNPIVRYTKYHQIENGTVKGDGYEPDVFLPNYKTERIKDLCAENDKIIIVCRYNLQISSLKENLKEIGKPIFVIQGATKNKDTVVQEAERAEKAIVLVNAACSEGYELPSFPLMVFASLSFSYKDYKQMIGRILRINKLKKNVYMHLLCDEIDLAVYSSIMQKQDFSIEIYSKEREAKNFE